MIKFHFRYYLVLAGLGTTIALPFLAPKLSAAYHLSPYLAIALIIAWIAVLSALLCTAAILAINGVIERLDRWAIRSTSGHLLDPAHELTPQDALTRREVRAETLTEVATWLVEHDQDELAREVTTLPAPTERTAQKAR